MKHSLDCRQSSVPDSRGVLHVIHASPRVPGLGGPWVWPGWPFPSGCRARSPANAREELRITDIEAHEVCPPFHDYNRRWLFRYHGLGIQLRTIYVAKTQSGLEGIGESWGRLPENDPSSRYIGTSALDWIGGPPGTWPSTWPFTT